MSKRDRFAYRPLPVSELLAFENAEEAWFWFIRIQKIRHEGGGPLSRTNLTQKPCDLDDIYRAVMRLYRQRHLSARHLRTLSQYGLVERAPDPRCEDEVAATALWEDAMGHMDEAFRAKGIVA